MSKPDQSQMNFSGGVQSYTNSANAGGTGYYVNLGGIKICWGITNALSLSAQSVNGPWTINFPTSFFSTIQSCVVTPTGSGVTGSQFISINADTTVTTSGIGLWIFQTANSTTTASIDASWIVIGT